MTFHDQKKSNSMTFRTIFFGNEHIQSKYGNFKEQHNASFKPQIVNKTIIWQYSHNNTLNSFNPFRLSFSELKCARGGHIIFLESIFQHSPHEIVIYSINRKSYNKKVNIL